MQSLTFANFIFAVFLLLSLLILVVLVLLMRQIKNDGRLPPEKMSTLAAVLFIPSIIIFGLVYKGISNWRADIQYEESQVEINAFVGGVYQPLAESRTLLLRKLKDTQQLLQDIESMELAYPNHFVLIRHVRNQWHKGYGELYTAYTEMDKEVRRAWIAHNTMDRQDVLDKFSRQAVQLVSRVKKAEQKFQQHIYSVQDEMIAALDSARKLLDSIRKPPKSKKQLAQIEQTRQAIKNFSGATRAELLAYLPNIDPRFEQELVNLQQLIRLAGQQAAVIRDHLQQNPDLEKPLTKIISDWKKLAEESKDSLQEILYAVEAEFVSRKLGLPAETPAIKAMHNSLRVIIPMVVGNGLKRREEIDKSYSIKLN